MSRHEAQHKQLKRREVLKMGAAGAAAAFGASGLSAGCRSEPTSTGRKAGAKDRPNILFVFSDQHRWQSLPFTEMPQAVASNFTRLAREGTSFDNCISTCPICVPYRGMLISGMWPHQSTIVGNTYFGNEDIIGVDAPTIAHTFKDAGYVTGYVGKWHLRSLGNKTMYEAGFDYFKHWLWGDNHWETKVHDIPSGEDYHVEKGYNAIGMTDQALDFMRRRAGGDRPFLMMLSWNPPHWRWNDAPEQYLKLYPEEELNFRPNTSEGWQSGTTLQYYRHYHAHVTAIDVQMGRILKALDKMGIADNTILIYTSDHGSCLGAHGLGGKANPYDESIRVPFLVRCPGRVPTGRRTDIPIGAIDLYPTLCGLTGIEPPEFCGGQDLSHLLLGAEKPAPDLQLIMLNNNIKQYYASMLDQTGPQTLYPFRGVRTSRYTYTVRNDGEWQLFDNREDPYQMNNLVDDPGHADLRQRLHGQLEALLAEAELPFISEQWRQLPLPERIRVENQYYVLSRVKGQWDRYKQEALEPFLKRGLTSDQEAELRQAADRVFDAEFFGKHQALKREIESAERHHPDRVDELREALQAHDAVYDERFKEAARRILGGSVE